MTADLATAAPAVDARPSDAPQQAGSASKPTTSNRLAWVDVLKGLAIFAVLLHHFPAPATGFALRLTGDGFPATLRHIWNLAGSVTTNGFDAVIAALAAFGYQGVHVFLIASGFGLAMADLKRDRPLRYGQFLLRRAGRLLPPYWAFVLMLGAIGLIQSRLHTFPSWLIGSNKTDLFVNVFLLRDFREAWVWIYPGALWFVPLIIQLYLCYPFIARATRRFGIAALVGCAVITLAYRTFGVFALNGGPVGTDGTGAASTPLMYFPARLFEFAFGVWLAQSGLLAQAPGRHALRSITFVVGGLGMWTLGTAAACYRSGFVVCDPLLGAGLFLVAFEVSRLLARVPLIGGAVAVLGRKSYSVYLMHSMLIPTALSFQPGHSFVLGLSIYCLAAFSLATVLDAILLAVRWLLDRVQSSRAVAEVSR